MGGHEYVENLGQGRASLLDSVYDARVSSHGAEAPAIRIDSGAHLADFLVLQFLQGMEGSGSDRNFHQHCPHFFHSALRHNKLLVSVIHDLLLRHFARVQQYVHVRTITSRSNCSSRRTSGSPRYYQYCRIGFKHSRMPQSHQELEARFKRR